MRSVHYISSRPPAHSFFINQGVIIPHHSLVMDIKSPRITDLPDSVLIEITKHLSQTDTLSLLYSNKRFHEPCRARLYRRLLVCDDEENHYLFKLAKLNKVTIVSKYNKMSFYQEGSKMFWEKSILAENLEELITYDSLDPYGHLGHLMKDSWDSLMKKCHNLKSFIAPKFPVAQLQQLSRQTMSNLTQLSINICATRVPFEFTTFELTNLRSLTLNYNEEIYDGMSLDDQIICNILNALKIGGRDINEKLESFEINSSFGTQDHHTEESVRNHNYLEEPCMSSAIVQGSRVRCNLDMGYNVRSTKKRIMDYKVELSDLEYDKSSALERMHKQQEDELLNSPVITNQRGSPSEYDMKSIELRYPRYDRTNSTKVMRKPSKDHVSYILKLAMDQKLHFRNIKNLIFSNTDFDPSHFSYEDTEFWRSFKSVFPFAHKKLRYLSLNNVTEEASLEDGDDSALKSLLTGFIDSGEEYSGLKKLRYYRAPKEGDFDFVEGQYGQQLTGHSKKILAGVSHVDIIADFMKQTPNLDELEVVAPLAYKLKHFYRTIARCPRRDQLKYIEFHSPEMIFSNSSKILNAKVFKKFKNFFDFRNVENYYILLSKVLAEHFINTTKVEYYEGSEILEEAVSEEERLFEREFHFIFGDEVQEFFKLCPELISFKLYGFKFYRDEPLDPLIRQ